MADVDGDLISNSFFDPEIDGVPGQTLQAGFSSPKVQDSDVSAVSNTTAATGGGGTVVRENPPLTRQNP